MKHSLSKKSSSPTSKTRSQYFNPYEKKWVKNDTDEQTQVLRKLVKMCERSDYKKGIIYDIKLKKQIKLSEKNKKLYKEHINFCKVYDKEYAYRDKIDQDILDRFLNSEIVIKGEKIQMKKIGLIKEAHLEEIAKNKGIPTAITTLSILMTKLITTDPEVGENVRRKAIDIINHTDGVFSSLFLNIFSKKDNVNILKKILLISDPIKIFGLFAGAFSAFFGIISGIFDRVPNFNINPVIKNITKKFFAHKTPIFLNITNANTVSTIKNDLDAFDQNLIHSNFNSYRLNTTLSKLGLEDLLSYKFDNLYNDLINDKASISFYKISGVYHDISYNFNEYKITSPSYTDNMIIYLSKESRRVKSLEMKNNFKHIIKNIDLIENYSTRVNNNIKAINKHVIGKVNKKLSVILTDNIHNDISEIIMNEKITEFRKVIKSSNFKEKIEIWAKDLHFNNVNTIFNSYLKIKQYTDLLDMIASLIKKYHKDKPIDIIDSEKIKIKLVEYSNALLNKNIDTYKIQNHSVKENNKYGDITKISKELENLLK
jgi:hypothetical protein